MTTFCLFQSSVFEKFQGEYLNPRGTHEAEATGEVDWWDRTRAENITITITSSKGGGDTLRY